MVETNQNQIAITNLTGVSVGDQFEVFVYYVGTETFEGTTSGEYMIGQTQTDPDLALVYYNGLRQNLNVDYTFVNGDKLVFNNGHDSTDTIIMTGITGRQGADGVAFQLFLDNVSAIEYDKTIKPVAVSTVSEDFGGLFLRINYTTGVKSEGKLLVVDSTGINSSSTWDPMNPGPYGTIDGNDVNVDVLEYINAQLIDGVIVSQILTRNGLNTSRPITENDIVVILDEQTDYLPKWQSYRISDEYKVNLAADLKLGDNEIQIDRVAGLPKQKPNEAKMEIPGVVWIGDERIEYYEREGTTLKQIRRATGGTSVGIPAVYDSNGILLSDWRTVTDFVYPAGTQVVDGSKRQEIPGGYRFDTTGFGIQYTNSLMGKFLQDKPGSC
jgi:hypothetical protein